MDYLKCKYSILKSWVFWVPVKVQAKQSTSFGKGHAFVPTEKKKYVKYLHQEIAKQYNGKPLTFEVSLHVTYVFKFRKRDKRFEKLGWMPMAQRPDLTNLIKPVEDAMQGVCFLDDSQVVETSMKKIRSFEQGVHIILSTVKPRRGGKSSMK